MKARTPRSEDHPPSPRAELVGRDDPSDAEEDQDDRELDESPNAKATSMTKLRNRSPVRRGTNSDPAKPSRKSRASGGSRRR